MPVRKVLVYPDAALKRRCDPGVDRAHAAVVAQDLLETMRSFPGCVGIAANQIGELVRIAVVDVTDHKKTTACHGELVLVDPRIVATRGSAVSREGCLSIPEFTANVRRAIEIEVAATAPDGSSISFATEGFEAVCVQHELDHLDGLLFLDRVDSLTDDVFRRRQRSS